MQENGLESFVVIPRKVASDYRNRLINRQERDVYVWLRMISNPYGIASVDLNGLAEDCFGRNVSVNFANKILLALKSKRYIYYEVRSGRRGSFEVHLGDWPLPRKDKSDKLRIKSLDSYFSPTPSVTGSISAREPVQSEVSTQRTPQGQRLEGLKSGLGALHSRFKFSETVRATYNDTENETYNYDSRSGRDSLKKPILVSAFVPNSWEEQKCHEIARELGEERMNFLLGTLHKYNLPLIERAWGLYKEDRERNKEIRNHPAYFNGVIQKLMKDDLKT